MRYASNTLLVILSVGLLTAAPVHAQTPDGETPAEETVCDALKADGITKGLYGLCVAFCEAQDHADENVPITAEDLEALEDNAPSGRILTNYNRKRDRAENPADPPMPCILVEEPCPCWTEAELGSIDGYAESGESILYSCDGPADIKTIREGFLLGGLQFALADIRSGSAHCLYRNDQVTPRVFRSLSVAEGTMTSGEAATCLSQIEAACTAAGL